MMKHALVVVVSLVAFVVPNVVGLGIWFLAGDFPTILRSLTAIMGWVVSFGLSSLLFWRLIQTTFGSRVAQ
jgi:hypothetical protein